MNRISCNNFVLEIDASSMRGFFEHTSLGDECGGGLWFERDKSGRLTLVDYDGVADLPDDVAGALMKAGIVIGNSEHAFRLGMQAGLNGELTAPIFDSVEDRMAFRAGWMEVRKRVLSDLENGGSNL